MNFESVLRTKSHNQHFLARYIKFITKCATILHEENTYLEAHHICPKADDMFPEFSEFSEHSWNKVLLTARQHFIAHLMLHKAFPNTISQLYSLNMMANFGQYHKSRIYENLRQRWSLQMSELQKRIAPERERKKIIEGTHPFLRQEFRDRSSHRMKTANPMFRKDVRERVSASTKGRPGKPWTDEMKQNLSSQRLGSGNPMFGVTSAADHLNSLEFCCSVCGAITNKGNWKRWHEEKCRNWM